MRLCAAGLLVVVALTVVPAWAQPTPPAEVQGRIDGKPARFLAAGDDVLLTRREADRLGLSYRQGKRLRIGSVDLWSVTLVSVTVAGQTRLGVEAGVVESAAAYFAALRSHRAEAQVLSRQREIEINGRRVTAYDGGIGGFVVAIAEARRIGLPYTTGRRQRVEGVDTWLLSVRVKVRPQEAEVESPVLVAPLLPLLRAQQAALDRKIASAPAR